MAKPTILPTWATDQTNNLEPSAGQKASGWDMNQPAISSYFNWLFYTIYIWLAYLDAGVFDGPITVNGNLNVTGTLDIDGVRLISMFSGDHLHVDTAVDVNGVVSASDFVYSRRTVLPAIITGASKDVTLSQFDPLIVRSTSTVWWYYTPSLPLCEGDTLQEVRVKYANNTTLSPVNVEVGYCKDGVVTYSPAATSSLGNDTIVDLLSYKIEVTNGVLDTVHIRVSGTSNDTELSPIEVRYSHGV